ncbi:efflux RND transporter periplasmic adaptor subunit [Sediminicola sp. 1XM1-17]|uniref:efflux RND transporter periplasmic adaptor subunit n=1 Tax=Sediminicola sp. 1XM1-17 TaxID=3127702 RepID=UPI003078023D
MKKNSLYIVLAVLGGLLAGYLIFGGHDNNLNSEEHDHSEEIASGKMWTCSMHPQIMQPEPGDCPICGMDLIPAESGADGLSIGQFKMTENAMALANIKTMVVGDGKVQSGALKLSGKIEENQEINGTQAAYFGGRIEKLYVNFEGEEIKKGQLLAAIYSPELVSAQQELLTASNLKESQPALYKAVRNKLKLWKLSDKQIELIESRGKVNENFPVYANITGTVSKIMVEEGDYIKQGAPLFSLANLSSVWAVFDSYENQVSSLNKDQIITVVPNSYPNTNFKAKISFINPILNSDKRTVEVRAVIQNKDGLLKPGMFVAGTVAMESGQKSDGIAIPESAVLWTGERSVVYIKSDQNQPIFEMREVTLGNVNNGFYQVLEGLENGVEIVVNGTFTVDAAAQLKGKKSMMNQVGAKTMTGHEGHTAMPMSTIGAVGQTEIQMPASFQQEFMGILEYYMEIKNALVSSNGDKARSTSKIALARLKQLKKTGLDQRTIDHLDTIGQMLDAISSGNKIESQRNHFIALSAKMISISTNLKALPSTLYVQNCPMANKNKGADWLSWEKEILNPYYGDAMLTCGAVKQVIAQ